MQTLRCIVLAFGLLGIMACGDAAKDAAKTASDLLLKQKDELVGKVEKMLPEAKSVMDDLTKKIGESSGDAKSGLEKILATLQEVYKKVTETLAELKKGGIEGLKDKIAALTKNSDLLSKIIAEARAALTKKGN
jgi:polyhydroxyalkanoate synthesis regulator phasin